MKTTFLPARKDICRGGVRPLFRALIVVHALFLGTCISRGATPPDSTLSPSDAELMQAYLPKEDLGVTQFLREHPSADGRGVIVAILDTGVDLHHPGLLRTPLGERKIIDVYDATDNGLCDLGYQVTTRDSVLTGLTGRSLHFGHARADDGIYHLGRLRASEIFPWGLRDRLLAERKEARAKMVDRWEDQVSTTDPGSAKTAGVAKDSLPPPDRTQTYRTVRREEDHRFDDPGPVYDLVAFRTAGRWRLLIDTNEDGDLGGETPLEPYHLNGDVAVFPPPASLNVALSWISDDGSRVSLFFDEGGHGTHVAGIVGAYYGPDDPLNGLAPGVRFLAVKIGNGRLGGGTSHNSMLKGIDWAVAHGAMAANLSFGGSSYFNDGREITAAFIDQVVQHHGIFVCASAGNEGPGLSTIGAPATARRVFTMGAAISPLTMLASYGGLVSRKTEPGATSQQAGLKTRQAGSTSRPPESLPPQARSPYSTAAGAGIRLFPFSSRGPLYNGSPGPDLVSPGAAVSTLPTWSLTREQNLNGTSMAAPQASGCIALLLSACLEDSTPVSPARLDRALKAGAAPLEGVSCLEQGAGRIQVPQAYAALRRLARDFPAPALTTSSADSVQIPGLEIPATLDPVTFWRITVDNATGTGEGYYERDLETDEPFWQTFQVRPDLPEVGANPLRNRFHRVVRLRSTVPWMEAPPQVSIPAAGTSIRVRLDPSRMSPGLNVGRIRLLDVASVDEHGTSREIANAPGAETELLATVIRPEHCSAPDFRIDKVFDLPPGERQSVFVKVPEGATRVRVKVDEELADLPITYNLAATAVSLLHPPETLRAVTRFDLSRGRDATFYQRVEPGTTLELTLFARWVNPDPGRIRLSAEFDGLTGPTAMGSTAQLGGEQGEAQRWGEPPVVSAPGRADIRLPVASPLKAVAVTAEASITGTTEPLDLVWSLRPDSLYTRPLEGKDAVIMLGRGWVRLNPDETVTLDLNEGPEFEDFLDDSFFRLFDPNGRLISFANLSNGPMRMSASKDGPAGGWYRIEFNVFCLGRDFVKEWPPFSPEIIRGDAHGRLTLYPDVVSGQTAAADSSLSFRLLRGASRALALRGHGLTPEAVVTGHVSFKDDDNAPALLRVPVRFDLRSPTEAGEKSAFAAAANLEVPARRLDGLPRAASEGGLPRAASVAEFTNALRGLDRSEAVLRALDGHDYDSSDEGWERLFLRVDLWLKRDDSDEARSTLAQLFKQAEDRLEKEQGHIREQRADTKNESVANEAKRAEQETRRRGHEGALAYRRSLFALHIGDLARARNELNVSADFGFGGENPAALEGLLLAQEGKPLAAVEPLRRACAADPWNARLAAEEIQLFLDLGWTDLAQEHLSRWLDRFPGEVSIYLEMLAKLRNTDRSAESRALSIND